MKGLLVAGLAAALCLAVAGTRALAESQFEVLYQHKAWEVQVVGFDDGSLACLAQVSEGEESFSIWADAGNLVKLQFYSADWEFGEGDTADLEVQIDRRTPWTLTAAELYLQSVLFNLPDSDVGTKFLLEVVKGNTLYLRDADGNDVRSYTLAGSSASIQVLIDCVDTLGSGGPDANPFN